MLAANLKRFKVITFDCTNTILFFKNPPEVQYVKTAGDFGFSPDVFDKDLVKKNFRKEFKELHRKHPNFGKNSISYQEWWLQLVTNVLMHSSREKIEANTLKPVAKKLIDQYKTRECWGKFPKSNELIESLKEAGKTVGVISNFDPRLHELLIDVNLPTFDFVATSYEAGFEKPNPKIFKYAAELSCQTFDPHQALHIGNEEIKDFEGAKSAGWSSILINSEAETQPHFKNIEEFLKTITMKEIKL